MAKTIQRSLSRNYTPVTGKNAANTNKNYMYPLVSGGVLLMIGLILFSTFTEVRIIPNYAQDIGFIIPPLFFFPVAFMAYKGSIPRKHCRIVTTILLVMSIIAIPLSAIMVMMDTYTTTVENPAYYNKTAQMLGVGSNDLLAPFPSEMPVDAEDTLFYYGTDMETGVMKLELRFLVGEGMADPLENGMKSRAIWTGDLAAFAASEYAAAAPYVNADALPADAMLYLHRVNLMEDGTTIDGMTISAAAPDGTLYYLYTVWMPQ